MRMKFIITLLIGSCVSYPMTPPDRDPIPDEITHASHLDIHNNKHNIVINMDKPAMAPPDRRDYHSFITRNKKELAFIGVVSASVITAGTTLIIHFTQPCSCD